MKVTPILSISRIKNRVQLGNTTSTAGTVLYRDAATARIADQATIARLTAEKEAAWGRLNVEQAPDKVRQFLLSMKHACKPKVRLLPYSVPPSILHR